MAAVLRYNGTRRSRLVSSTQALICNHYRIPKCSSLVPNGQLFRHMSTAKVDDNGEPVDDVWSKKKVASFVGHQFPDFIEKWSRERFRQVGYVLGGTSAVAVTGAALTGLGFVPAALLAGVTAAYWKIGINDMTQTSHAIRRNYPVLGNVRYIMETIRPELHQYIVEGDNEGKPFDRMRRALIYQRAKNVSDTIAFGTRRDVYDINYEWACHSMWPQKVDMEDPSAVRTMVGTAEYGTTKPYSASALNVSAMSYGAIGDNAILALNGGAKLGGFYHNTGEGGVSASHLAGGGDIVWNIGTGYFGCGSTKEGGNRVFEPELFKETVDESNGKIKMIEIKISQGAKPGHGGLLPKAKITPEIAKARKIPYPPGESCHSPPSHAEFSNAWEMIEFIGRLRELSGGLPVGIKLCVGDPDDVASLVRAMVETGNGPDFITIDGAEGGTGAAPPEYSNSIGMPLEEGIVVVRNLLVGAGIRDKTRINAAGRISSGFSLVRTMALGADYTCAARAFMMSLGCIQALKCNTNKCPTGIATQNKELQYGLDPTIKTNRVYHFHRKTVESAADIVGTIGHSGFSELSPNDIMRRVRYAKVCTLAEHFPIPEPGCLLDGKGPQRLQKLWDSPGKKGGSATAKWIY